MVGSNTNCKDVLCCRVTSGIASNATLGAGSYGTIGKCDLPVSVLEKMTEKLNALAPDLVVTTGDVVPHDLWSYS
jgi:hypothetical protein